MIDAVDPFIGTGPTDLPAPDGIAASWWAPKPPVGNTHPGATHPFGMVSACSYSGGYPTGYGAFERSTEGPPRRLHEGNVTRGFTHFQQSGTGAIRKYYNYLRVMPLTGPIDDVTGIDEPVVVVDEDASPGWYRANLANGIVAELTVGPKSAVHRYTFPEDTVAHLVLDCSQGGLLIEHGTTVPLRAHLEATAGRRARGQVVMEGVPISFHVECDGASGGADWPRALWYDHRLMPGGSNLSFDTIRPSTLRPFGLAWSGRVQAGQTVELRIGFSLRGTEQAAANLDADLRRSDAAPDGDSFATRRVDTARTWVDHLDRIEIETASDTRRSVFATALYHSMIKPCFAPGESPFWSADGPFVFDICTMWDIYRTQLPLVSALFPERAAELANALLRIADEEGNIPIGYRMAKGADRFFRQGSALAHTFFADLCDLGVPGIDWERALSHMEADLRRLFGEEYLENGVVHPISHTLDLATAYHGSAGVARAVGDDQLATHFDGLATRWINAFDPDTGLLVASSFYEGGPWNYSFRLVHDMAERIELAGGEAAYTALLDQFFGVDAPPVKQLGIDPPADEVAAGYALNRFEGLNNEPDMEAPWSYHWVGRPDRTTEIVHAVINNQFGPGAGGLPGNDDSGGLSSWYVWASLGLFPVAGQQMFLINAPSFISSTIRFGDATLIISAPGFVDDDARPQYVQSVTFDGRSIEQSWLTARQILSGGELVIALGPEPSRWATSTRPPSASRDLTAIDTAIDPSRPDEPPNQEQLP